MRRCLLGLIGSIGCGDGATAGMKDASHDGFAGDGGDAGLPGWRALAPVGNGPRQETAVVPLDGKIYLIGGFAADLGVSDDVESYDPGTDSWQSVASLPEPVHHANAAAVDGKLYVTGALQGLEFSAIGNTWIYDPQADAWSAGASMPEGTERGAAAVGVIGSRLYVAGGFRNEAVADFSSYDTANDDWDTLPALPAARDHLVGAAIDDTFFAIGGRQLGIDDLRDRVDAYTPLDGVWKSRATMPTPRGGCAAGVVGGRVFVVGGEGNPTASTGVFSDNEAYDPATDTWQVFDPMPTPRHGTGAAGLDGALYVPGGATQQGFGAVDTNEAFVVGP